MSSSSNLIFFLLASVLGSSVGQADTKRMQNVTILLGLDKGNGNQAAKDAEAAVERLVERGLRSHPNIKMREAELQATRARVDAAQGHYQPTLRLTGSGTQTYSTNLENDEKSRENALGGSIVLRENLWRGGQDAGQVDLARQEEALAEIRKIHEGEGLAYLLSRSAFTYNFRVFRQMIDEVSLADAMEIRSLADRKFSAGQVGKIDLHLTSMRESGARAAAARAAIETQQAYLELLNLIGPQESQDAVEQDIQLLTKAALPFPAELPELKALDVPTLNEKSSLALQKRAEISLDQNYRARYLPQIDLVGTLGRNDSSRWLVEKEDQKALTKTRGSIVELQFSWNLWDRSQDHLIRAAAAEKTAATSTLEASRFEASMEAQRLRRYITDLHKTLDISREAYRQAGQLYDAQRKLYEAGVIGIQPLMDAEREKRDAISAWQENVYELQLSLLQWKALQRGYLTGSGPIPRQQS
jgi:outer membrane protein TolC